jgi:hypothetical protein
MLVCLVSLPVTRKAIGCPARLTPELSLGLRITALAVMVNIPM